MKTSLMILLSCSALALGALPSGAQTKADLDLKNPLSAAQFQAFTQNRSLQFFDQGEAYGSEHYGPNHAVRWTFGDGTCTAGTWFEKDSQICFRYENESEAGCWVFYPGAAGLIAEFMGAAGGKSLPTTLYEASPSSRPSTCAPKDLGI